jgi:hypothetical protein
MKKTVKDGRDQFEALLEQRNTPRQDTGLSPVEMMFGRKTWTMLPFLNKCNETNRGHENRKLTVKKHHSGSNFDTISAIFNTIFILHNVRPWITLIDYLPEFPVFIFFLLEEYRLSFF